MFYAENGTGNCIPQKNMDNSASVAQDHVASTVGIFVALAGHFPCKGSSMLVDNCIDKI